MQWNVWSNLGYTLVPTGKVSPPSNPLRKQVKISFGRGPRQRNIYSPPGLGIRTRTDFYPDLKEQENPLLFRSRPLEDIRPRSYPDDLHRRISPLSLPHSRPTTPSPVPVLPLSHRTPVSTHVPSGVIPDKHLYPESSPLSLLLHHRSPVSIIDRPDRSGPPHSLRPGMGDSDQILPAPQNLLRRVSSIPVVTLSFFSSNYRELGPRVTSLTDFKTLYVTRVIVLTPKTQSRDLGRKPPSRSRPLCPLPTHRSLDDGIVGVRRVTYSVHPCYRGSCGSVSLPRPTPTS